MMNVGRVCVKIAGRDAGRPLSQEIQIKEKADHGEIAEAFKSMGIELKETKPKQKAEKPVKLKKASAEPLKDDKKAKKKAEKKEKADAKKEEKETKKAAKEEKNAKKKAEK
jgi:hypothetical protein